MLTLKEVFLSHSTTPEIIASVEVRKGRKEKICQSINCFFGDGTMKIFYMCFSGLRVLNAWTL